MALDRWIALILLGFSLVYGYTAWFTMDGSLAPFMRRNPIWPSTFPKVLSIIGIGASFVILLGLEKSEEYSGDINYRRLWEYNLGQAVLLLVLMVIYALLLRPFGFLGSTAVFIILGSFILGERRVRAMLLSGILAAYFVWVLVHIVLGIFMTPLPIYFPDLNTQFIAWNELLVDQISLWFGLLRRFFAGFSIIFGGN